MSTEHAPPGVTLLDHTADVGMEVTASTLTALFRRAALGAVWLVEGEYEADVTPASSESRDVRLASSDLPALMRAWLREVLHWREMEGRSFAGASFRTLTDVGLDAQVMTTSATGEPVREIKGVTLHGLVAERSGEGWFARVIFDV
ncbi:MAG: archease [Gemmatimonadota bacterium]|jgi:SHS2 domain-containing protein